MFVFAKKGLIVRKNQQTLQTVPGLGKEIIIHGKFSSSLPNCILPSRTLFKEKRIKINDQEFYLEVKGYGRNGKEMYFQEHCSGDVFYGMYLDKAIKEFERATKAFYDLHLPVALPVAAVEIPRDEYIKVGMKGFVNTIESLLCCRALSLEKIKSITGKINKSNRVNAECLINYTKRHYRQNIVDGIKFIVSELSNNPWEGLGINDKADALFKEKRIGYLIRASKSPYRVGDPSDKSIGNAEFSDVAISMGRTFRILLENGILHHCPGTGNWTRNGELTDFADTFDLGSEKNELEAHIKNLKNREEIKTSNLEDFLRYLIGPRHTGVLCSKFVEGMYGKGTTIEQTVRELLRFF